MVLWKVFITVCTPSLMVSSLTSPRYNSDDLISSFTRAPVLSFLAEHSKRRSSPFLFPSPHPAPSAVFFCFIALMRSSCLHANCYLVALCAMSTVDTIMFIAAKSWWVFVCVCTCVWRRQTEREIKQGESNSSWMAVCLYRPPLWSLFSSSHFGMYPSVALICVLLCALCGCYVIFLRSYGCTRHSHHHNSQASSWNHDYLQAKCQNRTISWTWGKKKK